MELEVSGGGYGNCSFMLVLILGIVALGFAGSLVAFYATIVGALLKRVPGKEALSSITVGGMCFIVAFTVIGLCWEHNWHVIGLLLSYGPRVLIFFSLIPIALFVGLFKATDAPSMALRRAAAAPVVFGIGFFSISLLGALFK